MRGLVFDVNTNCLEMIDTFLFYIKAFWYSNRNVFEVLSVLTAFICILA